MRYKCVIPMVIDQEAKEHEKQQKKMEKEKEKEEEHSTTKIENEYVNEAEINESKNRVHEHFKQISQINKQMEIPLKKKKKSKQLILNQIHGGKRKREFNIKNENPDKNNDDFSTMSTSYLNPGTVQASKKIKQEAQKAIEERKMQESFKQVQSGNNSETVKSIR